MLRFLKRHRRDEEGAVAVMVAVSMLALLIVTGLVTDIGQARVNKVTNKGYSDAAAMAGIHAADAGDQTEHSFAGACAALAYLQVNDPAFSSPASTWMYGNGTVINGNPCQTGYALTSLVCQPNTSSTFAWYTGTAPGVSVEIKSGYVMPDPAFDPPGSGDNSLQGGCDQLAVIIRQTEDTTFGRAAGVNTITTAVRSVARATINNSTTAVAGLLLLERHACNALAVSGTSTVHVYGNGTYGGAIQVDSLGDTCSSGQKVISTTSGTTITAHKAESGGQPGTIMSTALSGLPGAVPGNASSGPPSVCAEQANSTCLGPTGSPVVGRSPVDRRYLSGVRTAMSAAAAQYSKGASPGSTAAGVPYTVLTCSNIASSNAVAIFVNCPGGATIGSTNAVSFPNATDVVFNGSLTFSNSGSLSMPKVARFYVKGAPGTNGITVAGATSLKMNQGSNAGCNGYPNPTQAAKMVVGNGSFVVSNGGTVQLCGTSVLMADNYAGSCPLPTSTAGTGQAPYDNSCGGSISISGAGATDWTAPDLYATSAPPDWSNLEDLALWTETSSSNAITNGGSLQMTGVFFLPNANPFQISGAGSQNGGANVQFIARRLVVANSGQLFMRPNATDVVPVPMPDTYNLVR